MKKLLLPRDYRDPDELHKKLHLDPEPKWKRRGNERAMELFHKMAKRVPAYKDFLKINNFDPDSVKSIADFANIPVVDKDNYLRKYPYNMLCWDGKFAEGQWVISTTSGSSGKPYYFPRERSQEWQYAVSAEQYLRNNFDIGNKTTLYIIAFPMGAWIGGVFTYEALKLVNRDENYKLSIITAGIDKQEVINSVKQFGKDFDQIIIGSYAPFLKDILDDGESQGLKWADYNIGFIFAAEVFSELFRSYLINTVKPKNDLLFTLNHYGTVDLGTMAHETAESILVRRLLSGKGKLGALLPESSRQPTLCQYNPQLFYFEEVDKNLLCSAFSGIPLVRYDLKDYGGVIKRTAVIDRLKKAGIDLDSESKAHKIDQISWNLPYVYIYERNDFSISYYAFLIYPEMIRKVLQAEQYKDFITGKFTMYVEYDKSGRQRLFINVEKKHGVADGNLKKVLTDALHENLKSDSSEYRETSRMVGQVVKPLVQLWVYEDTKYFKSGGKQKWVTK